jgi:hypothetical protein
MRILPLALVLSTATFTRASVSTSPQNPANLATPPSQSEGTTVRGERLDPSAFGPAWVESMEDVIRRERENPPPTGVYVAHPPRIPPGLRAAKPAPGGSSGNQNLGGGGSPPTIGTNFVGPKLGDPGGGWVPPDTCGAVGINHFVSVVNSNISVWNKTTGARLMNVSQASFWATGSLGDGRCVFDPNSQRFILMSDDFNTRLFFAVSSTSDPTGSWFKTSINLSQGVDAGHWPDYPTLGVDANGIYSSAYMVGSPDLMSLFAIDKAPLVAATQSLGTVTAFRHLSWEGAIHPCVTYGTPSGEYCISWGTLYRVNAPLTLPTLTNLGTAHIPGFSAPPNAPAMGSTSLLDTLDGRLLNAVYRNGYVWTANAVFAGGRSACRWYQINTSPIALTQFGTIDDPSLYYFFPGLSVNANGHMVVGFTGSDSSHFAGCYVTGRKATDTTGQTAPPQLFKTGDGSYNDGGNPSRWGDYSLTSVDPTNDLDFWTIQEYARTGNQWGTWIAQILYDNCVAVAPTSFCTAAGNSFSASGSPISFTGTNSISLNNFGLQTFNVPPNKLCLAFYGLDQTAFLPMGNGIRCINSPFYRIYPATTSNLLGDVDYPVNLHTLPPAGHINAGQSWGFQIMYRDPAAGGGNFNVTDGLSTTWCP